VFLNAAHGLCDSPDALELADWDFISFQDIMDTNTFWKEIYFSILLSDLPNSFLELQ
jgi:hypothetical protein